MDECIYTPSKQDILHPCVQVYMLAHLNMSIFRFVNMIAQSHGRRPVVKIIYRVYICIYIYLYYIYRDFIGSFQKKRGTSKWMVYNGNIPIKMDDLGVPPFSETSIYIYIYIWYMFCWTFMVSCIWRLNFIISITKRPNFVKHQAVLLHQNIII